MPCFSGKYQFNENFQKASIGLIKQLIIKKIIVFMLVDDHNNEPDHIYIIQSCWLKNSY